MLKKTYLGVVVLALLSVNSAWAFGVKVPDPLPAPNGQGDYCIDEAVTWAKHRFGGSATILGTMRDKNVPLEKETRFFRVHIWTDLCQDYFTFGYGFYGYERCEKPQYQQRTSMLWTAGAMGDCTRALPRMEFPNP